MSAVYFLYDTATTFIEYGREKECDRRDKFLTYWRKDQKAKWAKNIRLLLFPVIVSEGVVFQKNKKIMGFSLRLL